MKITYLSLLALILLNISLHSQDVKDSSVVEKVERIPDSLLSIPLLTHGKLFQNYKPYRTINKWDLQLKNYINTNDIINFFSPFYNLHLGAYSTFNSFNAFGGGVKSNSFAFNGRNLYDQDIGSYNPEQFSPEFFENMEIYTGSDAVVFADNSSGFLINFQEIRYNTGTPFTRIWFGNSGYGYLGADGVFSQNIRPNVNFTFGFRSYNSVGNFENGWGNNWNARLMLRWNPDNLTSISLSESYSNTGSGTSGGIDIANSDDYTDRLSAIPVFEGLNERNFRNDLTLSATRKFDTAGINSLSISLYMSSVSWDRSSGSLIIFDDSDTTGRIYNYSNSYYGAEGRYELDPSDYFSLRIGAYSEVNSFDKTIISSDFNGISSAVFGHAKINFGESFSVSGGSRIFSKFGKFGLSYGAKQRTIISKSFDWMLDFSYSDRLPYPVEGLNLNSEQHLLVLSEFNYTDSSMFKLTAGGFFRTVFSPIQAELIDNYKSGSFLSYQNGENVIRTGAYAEVFSNILHDVSIHAKALIQYSIDESGNNLDDYPLLNLNLRAFYTYEPGKSKLMIGLESGILTGFKGSNFYPLHRTFYPGTYDSQLMNTGLNVFAEIKLGNSFVKLTYFNILDNFYFYTAVNPMFGRNFRLSANWAFLED
ncbi:hypothetical protein MASR1M45_03460 [Candidatus Kapaibacterium sp.]